MGLQPLEQLHIACERGVLNVMMLLHLHRFRVSYYAVFDGHNGARASRFAAENLHHNIALKFPKGMFGQDPPAGWTRQSGRQRLVYLLSLLCSLCLRKRILFLHIL